MIVFPTRVIFFREPAGAASVRIRSRVSISVSTLSFWGMLDEILMAGEEINATETIIRKVLARGKRIEFVR